ncbi:MAG: Type secretion system protein TadC, associated with Flp pilus assembly [Myxococcales bacterium]|nr:Type secretion system protein TadC, associated with Flp pilus assembly [Myxococcales bacterium]
MHMSAIYLGVALVAAAAAAMASVLLFIPSDLRDPVLRGYRATRRRDSLAGSALLRLAWPLIRLCTYYAQLVPAKDWKEKKSEQLRNAGEPAGLSPDEFMGLLIASSLSGVGLAMLFTWALGMGFGLVIVGAFLGITLPNMWLSEKAQTRLASINRGLPQALDLVVLSMGAGLDFIGAVRHVVEKWSNKRDPLCEELSRFLHELSLGKTRKEALEDLAYRAPTELVKAFVNNAVQAEKRGTPLVEILRIQADVARTKRFQTAEKIAGRAGVVILMPLMFIFAATVLIMFGSLIVKGFRGQLF